MHVQQAMAYPYGRSADYPTELVADCGSQLLGSNYLPYLEEGCAVCRGWIAEEARWLIAGAW